MCTLATALMAGGTLLQGYSQYQAGKAQAEAASYNAQLAQQQGRDAAARGAEEEMNLQREIQRRIGTQRAAAAASGVSPDSGSSLLLQNQTIDEGARDAAAIRLNAAREQWGYNTEAVNYRNQASAARSAGRNALFGSAIGAAAGAYEPTSEYLSSVRRKRAGRSVPKYQTQWEQARGGRVGLW